MNLVKNSIYKPYCNMDTLIEKQDKCLLVAPHPDDDSIGCGGILYKHKEQFDCVCTNSSALDSEASIRNIKVEDIADERINEFNNVMKKLNLQNYWIFKIYGSRPLMYKVEENFNNYLKVLDFNKYDKIFVPYRYDSHREHRYVSNSLIPRLMKKTGYKKTAKIAYYEVWASILDYNYFEDISDYIDKKTELINTYTSRIKAKYAERILGLNYFRGFIAKVEYAEAFKIISANEYINLPDDMSWNR